MIILPIDLDRCIDAINNNANVVRKLCDKLNELVDSTIEQINALNKFGDKVNKQSECIIALRDALSPRSEAAAADFAVFAADKPKPRNGKTRMRQKKRNARAGAAP